MTLLSDDAVAALVDAAREGKLEEGQYLAAPRKRVPTIRQVDFRRTVKFKSKHQDRIRRTVETFCRTASTRLSSDLRTNLSLELTQVEQGMWSRAHADVRRSSTCLVLAPDGQAFPVLMAIDQRLVLEAVDRLLGADLRLPVADRALTELDRTIARRVFALLAQCLASAWKELCDEDLALQRTITYDQAADLTPVEEATLVLGIEARFHQGRAPIALLVPFNAAAASASGSQAQLGAGQARSPQAQHHLSANLAEAEVELRAQVAELSLSVERILSLGPGDLLALRTPARQGLVLYADQVPLHAALPGRNGNRRAVQIDTSMELPR